MENRLKKYSHDPELYGLLKDLFSRISQLEAENFRLRSENLELKSRLSQDSHNSHKPPSSDGLRRRKKIKNNRISSGRRPGGQKGHKGTTLKQVSNPDKVIIRHVDVCPNCSHDLSGNPIEGLQRRQVFDIPAINIEVTQYELEVKRCSDCGKKVVAHCPEASQPVQYGTRIQALAGYLLNYQFLPYERMQEFSNDILGINLSDGFLERVNDLCYEHLDNFEIWVKEQLKQSDVIHNDETGFRCMAKTQWVHVTSTPRLTHYFLHPKRGKKAIDANNILTTFRGVSVHDRWASYEKYSCAHAYCNAHLLRELKFISEEQKKQWASQMIQVLLDAKEISENPSGAQIGQIKKIIKRYKNIIESGIAAEPPPIASKKRGRRAKSKSLRLLEVFRDKKENILRFLYDPNVPFDNNLAERDLRMIKLKQKISGSLRTQLGAKRFCRIRSFIATVKKQNLNIIDAIAAILNNQSIWLNFQRT